MKSKTTSRANRKAVRTLRRIFSWREKKKLKYKAVVGVSELGLDLYGKIGRWVTQKFGFSVDWKLFFKENISAFRLVFNTEVVLLLLIRVCL